MSIKSFNLDQDITELAQRLYPRQLSRLINDFLRDLVNAEVNLGDYNTKGELKEAINKKKSDLNQSQAELRILKTQLSEINKEEQKNLNIEEIKNQEQLTNFRSLGIEKDVQFKATFELAIQKQMVPLETPPHKFYFEYYNKEDFVKEVWRNA